MAYAKVKRPTSETQLKELDDVIKCCICTQTFVSPKTLPCSHTFCLKCLESYAADKKQGDQISCPVCRREWKIPVDGVQGFQRNVFAEKLAELAQKPDWASKEASCDVCRENADNPNDVIPVAEKHCIQCQQNMCEDCVFHHKRNRVSKQHEIIDLEGLKESSLVKITSTTCEKHPSKPLVVYCLHCSVPVCQMCFQESHSSHQSEDVKQRADKVKKQLEGVVTEIMQLSGAMNNLLNIELPKSFLDIIARTEVEINRRCMEVKQIVDLHEKRLFEYLEIVKKRRQKEVSAEKTDAETCLAEMENFLMKVLELQEQGSISDLSSNGTMLMSRAQELQAKHDNVHKKLKAKTTLAITELVPVDIDDHLSYNIGNLIGKIKVNNAEKGLGNDNNYYSYDGPYDDDDKLYSDCVYIRDLDPSVLYESTRDHHELPALHRVAPQIPPRQPNKTTPSGTVGNSGSTLLDDSNLNEIQPSAVVLHDKLHCGKYTEIFRGKLNRSLDVSVKTLTQEATTQGWFVNSSDFFREADILQKLSHPNIVNLIGVSTLSSPFYVITEFTSNGFLDKFLKSEMERRSTIQLKDTINMAAQIAEAMNYLETRNCIHRFLAARSILIGVNYSVKIANFDMALFLKSVPQGRVAIHTDVYELSLLESPITTRAPEVMEAQRWSIKSDVWSFAIVIYEILTYGAKPYPDFSESELLNRILTTRDILCPAGPNFKYPNSKLRSIMESCWKKDPDDRPDFKYLCESCRDFFKQQDLMGYMRRPKIIKALKLKGPVSGVTVYKEEIFIIRSESTTIYAFNSSTFKRSNPILTAESKKFQILRKRKQTQNYNGLQDITSCKKKDLIYVSSWQDCLILRIDPVSRSVSGSWEVKNADPTTLAVTQYGNLLASCTSEGKVLEYTFDGKLVHEINFGCDGEGPQHTLHFKNELLVVCHGRRQAVGANDGVTIIDKYGNVIPELKPLASPQPCHLAIDSKNNILIAARGHNKLILWNPEKGSQRVLISLDQEMKVPTRLHFNESTGQLLMLFRNNTLIIYQVKSTEANATAEDCDDYCSYATLPPRASVLGRVSTRDPDEYLYEELNLN